MHKTIYRHELIENPRSVKKYLGQGNGRYEVNMAGGGGRQIGMIYFYYLFGKMDYDAIDESERKLSDYEILSTIGKSMVFDFFNFTFK